MPLEIIALIIAIIFALVYFLVLAPSKPQPAPAQQKTQLPPQATPWTCYDGFTSPMRKNMAGDVECMSVNAKDCMWKGDQTKCAASLQQPAESIKPLTCGEAHAKAWGTPGYDNPEHWCSKVKTLIPFA